MKKLLPIVAGLAVLFCGGASGQTAGRPATERYVIQKISDYSTTNGSMNVAIQALASAVVAATNLQAAITAEAAARASGDLVASTNLQAALDAETLARIAGDAVASTNLQAALTAEAQARASGDLVAMTNWQAVVYSLTNGAALGATALQPSWATTGTVAHAETVTGGQSNLIAGAASSVELGVVSNVLDFAIAQEALARASGDLVAMTNWQARVNALTNGAALGETALQPAWAATGTVANAVNADNTAFAGMAAELLRPGTDGEALDAAAAHAATEHSVTEEGGFQAGSGANAAYGGAVGAGAIATEGGGAVGYYASAAAGGAVGSSASAPDGGGAVGYSASVAWGGGAVGDYAHSDSGGAVGASAKTSDGFAGGKDAFATSDGTFSGDPIDAIQLGTGGNSTPMTLQIYTNRLLNADGTIPVERMRLHADDENAHPHIREAIDAIPLPPTNAVAGWLVWDTGSNVYWRVSATNLRFYVWGVAE